ncbi:MAG: hypothetical protein RIB93_31285 [Coleofasciculus sp. D1-CHI-01]|uniref:hypothetical protein n=1 Tax=Coleofasciculus sp. D1-CHI-01 TaxID=3068482 RepID=UPI003300F281
MIWVAESIFKYISKQAIAFYLASENLINVRSRLTEANYYYRASTLQTLVFP